jgi:hypothetical protein
VPKRPWKETKLVISLPDDILSEYAADATLIYTSIEEYLRHLLIARKRTPQPIETPSAAPAAPVGIAARPSRSGYKGVYAYGKRWEAVAFVSKRRHRLSVHETPEDAARAYDMHLVAQAGGDPYAAMNFPPDAPSALNAANPPPFVEQFASGRKLSDVEWKQWQQNSQNAAAATPMGPLSVMPEGGAQIDASTPLIDRPAKPLYRRDSTPVMIAPPLDDPEPEPAPESTDPDEN